MVVMFEAVPSTAKIMQHISSLADLGGAHPALAPPPITAADLRFVYAQNANFSQFFLCSRLILSIILIEIWPNHTKI